MNTNPIVINNITEITHVLMRFPRSLLMVVLLAMLLGVNIKLDGQD